MLTIADILRPADQQDEFTKWMRTTDGGYVGAKVLRDDSYAGIMNLAFTHAICMGVERDGSYARRYCFQSLQDCLQAFSTLESLESEPTGWLARRPQYLEAQFTSIHSAPRDGTVVRVAGFSFGYCDWVALVKWEDESWVVVKALGGVQHLGDATTCTPTHWQNEDD